jgi:pimeloyl-ACP methyl ester carboxylesterase
MPEIEINGAKLHYRETGSGAPLLLIHGTGGHGDVFEPIVSPLATRYRVISYDRRGFSRSATKPYAAKSYYSHHAADAAALLRALGAAPASVLGWSGGGTVALTLAVEHPDVLTHLVLYEPALHVKKHMTLDMAPRFVKTLLLGLIGRKRAAATTFFRLALEQSDGKNTFDELDAPTRESMLANADGVLAELKAGTGEELTPERLRQIRAPVTDILGSVTAPFLTAATDRLAVLLPSMRVVQVPGGNHIMIVNRSAEFASLVHEALASHDAVEPLPAHAHQPA